MVNTLPKTARNPRHLSKATGDILKAIYTLQGDAAAAAGGGGVSVALPSEIAARTGTSRAFVTKMLKMLKEQELVEYAPYRGVRLTPSGARSATELSRHHRLLEYFLANTLGFSLEDAHTEAERLEHVISEQFEARLDIFLGRPQTCPHGAPIPAPDSIYSEVFLNTVDEKSSAQ
ncbi:MAG: metal-dependent transcriptional regulator [Cytophagales bacterium]|nr:metal-dependent transcriptional regulator [Armatimonadota bacterium]